MVETTAAENVEIDFGQEDALSAMAAARGTSVRFEAAEGGTHVVATVTGDARAVLLTQCDWFGLDPETDL